MSNREKFYINGEWVEPSTSDRLDVINPATEESIGQVPLGGQEDVDKAVAAAVARSSRSVQQPRKNELSCYRRSSTSTRLGFRKSQG